LGTGARDETRRHSCRPRSEKAATCVPQPATGGAVASTCTRYPERTSGQSYGGCERTAVELIAGWLARSGIKP
jgi:hypothetical protein